MKDPEPLEEGSDTKQEEPSKYETLSPSVISQDLLTKSTSAPQVIVASVTSQTEGLWDIEGTFDVEGILTTNQACCVIGKVESVELQTAVGTSLSVTLDGFDIGLSAYRNVKGVINTAVSVCETASQDYTEQATIDVLIPFQLSLYSRYAVVETAIGPVALRAGGELAGYMARVELGEGRGPTTTFNVDDAMSAFTLTYGAFISVGIDVGAFEGAVGLSVLLGGLGDLEPETGTALLNIGVGLGF